MELGHLYIRAKYLELPSKQFEDLAKNLESEILALAQDTFGNGIKIEFTLEEGTLREKIRIWGLTLFLVLDGISHYHDLRESVMDMYKDAMDFSNAAITQFHNISGASRSDVLYTRTIPPDVKKLHNIIQSIDSLSIKQPDSEEAILERSSIISNLASLRRSHPTDPGILNLMNALPKDKIPNLPATPDALVAIDERQKRKALPPIYSSSVTIKDEPKPRQKRKKYQHTTEIPH